MPSQHRGDAHLEPGRPADSPVSAHLLRPQCRGCGQNRAGRGVAWGPQPQSSVRPPSQMCDRCIKHGGRSTRDALCLRDCVIRRAERTEAGQGGIRQQLAAREGEGEREGLVGVRCEAMGATSLWHPDESTHPPSTPCSNHPCPFHPVSSPSYPLPRPRQHTIYKQCWAGELCAPSINARRGTHKRGRPSKSVPRGPRPRPRLAHPRWPARRRRSAP